MERGEHMRPTSERAVGGMFRTGRVDSIDNAKHTARVLFEEDGEEDGGVQSADLPVLVRYPGDRAMPPAGTLVLCAMQPGAEGIGWILGCHYSESDAPPTEDAGVRVVKGDDLRLGGVDAEAAVALAPATKGEIQKVLDYAAGISDAINAGVAVPQDGGANLKTTIVAGLPVKPSLDDIGAEKVTAL